MKQTNDKQARRLLKFMSYLIATHTTAELNALPTDQNRLLDINELMLKKSKFKPYQDFLKQEEA